MTANPPRPSILDSKFPVLFPTHTALTLPSHEFETFIKADVTGGYRKETYRFEIDLADLKSNEPVKESYASVLARHAESNDGEKTSTAADEHATPQHPFVAGLLDTKKPKTRDTSNMMPTEKGDLAHQSTGHSLVDLFFELEAAIGRLRLDTLLTTAWREDALATLKIIFNARSIHLGKSSRQVFYRCLEWLATYHPLTCLINLQWLSRPMIEKKVDKAQAKAEGEDDIVVIEAEKADDDPTKFDTRNGLSHGYYKDLLNILVLVVSKNLDNPQNILNIQPDRKSKKRAFTEDEARTERRQVQNDRHTEAIKAFTEDSFYRGLHLTVARIFAAQLTADLKLLRKGDKDSLRQISLCGKWAPSQQLFHDKHTFIVSSIAEILHPQDEFKDITDREMYLRRAREAYRKDVSALRKALGVVERSISAQKFEEIKYDRVPSLAMRRYTPIFCEKDENRFRKYVEQAVMGTKQISGATLLPSTLIAGVREDHRPWGSRSYSSKASALLKRTAQQNLRELEIKVASAQWKTLVQRIKDSGTLESSIAVCDVSGSMLGPEFPDGTTPIDSSIGLSLLLAEVVKPPFDNLFITFSQRPEVVKVDPNMTLKEKVAFTLRSPWQMNTDFVAVFKDLLLPMALEHKLKPEEMVKRIFVFSDMHFDQAESTHAKLTTSFERIKAEYQTYGYEMPELIFWNLAGGRSPRTIASHYHDTIAPKPVTVDIPNTSLVSGYSQGLLKVFLDNGSFEDPVEEEKDENIVEKEVIDDDGDAVMVVDKAKAQKNPLTTVKRAISHKAYDMLKVVD